MKKYMHVCAHEDEKTKIFRMLDDYEATSQSAKESDLRVYKAYCFGSYSALELAEMEHTSRYTIYRRIRRVDDFLKSKLANE